MKDSRKQKLKKKLFVTGAMVIVSAVLLVVVSFGQYRIKITGEIQMPEAADIQASIELVPGFINQGENTEVFLTDLQPGDSAQEFASESNVNRRFKLTVSNATGTNVSQVGLKYSIIITTDNRLPLDFYLVPVSDTDAGYSCKDISGSYRFYDGESEKMFTIAKGTSVVSDEYYIYTGWNNKGSVTVTNSMHKDTTGRKNTDAKYRKEVDVINVKVNVVSDEYDPYYGSNKEWYNSKITSPLNNGGES